MKFSNYSLTNEVKRGVDGMGFKKPTDIQFKSIPSILKGEDVLGIAQTGTGKTAAFAIPIVHKVQISSVKGRKDGVRCLIMVPTRELAQQIQDVFNKVAKYTTVKTYAIIGGVDQDPQIEKLNKGVDVLIATPGRMFDLISQGYLSLHRINTLVLDEADRMLDLGFYKDIQDVLKKLPKKRQTLFFSATINTKIKKLAYSLVNNAIRIQISPKDPVSKNVNHFVSSIEMDDKRFFLENLINKDATKKIMVFVRTQVRVERVAKAMERVGINALIIHGGKDQKERNQALKKFKEGEVNLLIATDVSARGVDVPGIELVVNYDLPDIAENYVHRIGRTGRGNQKGEALSFVSKGEMDLLLTIEQFLGKKIPQIEISKKEYQTILDLTNEKSLDDLLGQIEFEIENEGKKAKKKRNKKK
ncbi:MAG: RNA helicase [Flavobacteriales bacterium]|nr:RNA helicase [Flavobacteriales bacterium]|tara:strand:- start:24670 stop:25917 length:1248 start_codon:yes stop_codon:yes gene_type:complete